MTRIERTLKELDDLRQFYYQIKQRKQPESQASGSGSDSQVSKPIDDEIEESHPTKNPDA
jgi:hypothetical protein